MIHLPLGQAFGSQPASGNRRSVAICLTAALLLTASLPSSAATGIEIVRDFFMKRSVEVPSPSAKHLPPFEVAQVSLMTEGINGVTLNVTVSRGATADDAIRVKVDATVPPDKRMCMAYAAFEAIGMESTGGGRYRGLDYESHRCLEKPATGLVSDTWRVYRRDTYQMDNTLTQTQKEMRDGYAVVIVTVDDKPVVYRVDSVYFRRSSIKSK